LILGRSIGTNLYPFIMDYLYGDGSADASIWSLFVISNTFWSPIGDAMYGLVGSTSFLGHSVVRTRMSLDTERQARMIMYGSSYPSFWKPELSFRQEHTRALRSRPRIVFRQESIGYRSICRMDIQSFHQFFECYIGLCFYNPPNIDFMGFNLNTGEWFNGSAKDLKPSTPVVDNKTPVQHKTGWEFDGFRTISIFYHDLPLPTVSVVVPFASQTRVYSKSLAGSKFVDSQYVYPCIVAMEREEWTESQLCPPYRKEHEGFTIDLVG